MDNYMIELGKSQSGDVNGQLSRSVKQSRRKFYKNRPSQLKLHIKRSSSITNLLDQWTPKGSIKITTKKKPPKSLKKLEKKNRKEFKQLEEQFNKEQNQV